MGIATKRASAISDFMGQSRFVQASMEIAYAMAVSINSLINRFDAWLMLVFLSNNNPEDM
jgi:hypothetical protein